MRMLEVVKFTCFLMEEPCPLICHVCAHFSAHIRSQKRRFDVDRVIESLIDMDQEILGKSLNPLRNSHVTYHMEFPLDSSDERQGLRPSSLHIFGPMYYSTADPDRDTTEMEAKSSMEPNSCGIVINEPEMDGQEVLEAISSLQQTITDLHIEFIDFEDAVSANHSVFKIDPKATLVFLERCKMPQDVLRDLGSQLASCSNLEVICIARTLHVAPEVVPHLGAFKTLTFLDMKSCGLSHELCSILCQNLQFIHHLEWLDLRENPIGGTGSQYLADSIKFWGFNPPVYYFILDDCDIRPPGSLELMKALSSCRNITYIGLARNSIGSAGAKFLAKSIRSWNSGRNSSLLDVTLCGCDIDSSGCIELIKSFSSCRNLKYLDLNGNPLGGVFKTLAASVQRLDRVLPEIEAYSPPIGWISSQSKKFFQFQNLLTLKLSDTLLLKEDVLVLRSCIELSTMPKLRDLHLGYDLLKDVHEESREMTETSRVLVDKLLYVFVVEGDVRYNSKAIEEKLNLVKGEIKET